MSTLDWLLLLFACGSAPILIGWVVAAFLMPKPGRPERDWKTKSDR